MLILMMNPKKEERKDIVRENIDLTAVRMNPKKNQVEENIKVKMMKNLPNRNMMKWMWRNRKKKNPKKNLKK